MFYHHLRILSFLCSFTFIGTCKSEDAGTLKTEYSELAKNGSGTNNHRQWRTLRHGRVILTHEETGVLGRGTFELIVTRIFHNDTQILQISSSLGKRLCSFEPQAKYKAFLIDADSDGVYETIAIRDSRNRLLDSFTMPRDGRITPIDDAELERQRKLELREREGG